MTLNVILCALLVSSPERTVWTFPRNDWWARNVTAAIDINDQLTVCFSSFVSITISLFFALARAEEHASAWDAMAIE